MSSKTVSLREASSTLPELIDAATRGQEVIISTGNQPVAKIVPFRATPTSQVPRNDRAFGQFRGKIRLQNDFDAPLPDDFWSGQSTE